MKDEDIELINNEKNCIIASLFKLFKLCLVNYHELPKRVEKEEENINIYKSWITEYREEYEKTGNEELRNYARKQREYMIDCRIRKEGYTREIEEMQIFLNELTGVISAILSSPLVELICGDLSIITLYYIFSVYFFSVENYEIDPMKNYEECIYKLLLVYVIQSLFIHWNSLEFTYE